MSPTTPGGLRFQTVDDRCPFTHPSLAEIEDRLQHRLDVNVKYEVGKMTEDMQMRLDDSKDTAVEEVMVNLKPLISQINAEIAATAKMRADYEGYQEELKVIIQDYNLARDHFDDSENHYKHELDKVSRRYDDVVERSERMTWQYSALKQRIDSCFGFKCNMVNSKPSITLLPAEVSQCTAGRRPMQGQLVAASSVPLSLSPITRGQRKDNNKTLREELGAWPDSLTSDANEIATTLSRHPDASLGDYIVPESDLSGLSSPSRDKSPVPSASNHIMEASAVLKERPGCIARELTSSTFCASSRALEVNTSASVSAVQAASLSNNHCQRHNDATQDMPLPSIPTSGGDCEPSAALPGQDVTGGLISSSPTQTHNHVMEVTALMGEHHQLHSGVTTCVPLSFIPTSGGHADPSTVLLGEGVKEGMISSVPSTSVSAVQATSLINNHCLLHNDVTRGMPLAFISTSCGDCELSTALPGEEIAVGLISHPPTETNKQAVEATMLAGEYHQLHNDATKVMPLSYIPTSGEVSGLSTALPSSDLISPLPAETSNQTVESPMLTGEHHQHYNDSTKDTVLSAIPTSSMAIEALAASTEVLVRLPCNATSSPVSIPDQETEALRTLVYEPDARCGRIEDVVAVISVLEASLEPSGNVTGGTALLPSLAFISTEVATRMYRSQAKMPTMTRMSVAMSLKLITVIILIALMFYVIFAEGFGDDLELNPVFRRLLLESQQREVFRPH